MPQRATVTGTVLDSARSVGDGAVAGSGQEVDRVSVDLLGGLCVRAGGVSMGPRELGGAKPRHVLVALLLSRGRPVSKDRLMALLWGGSPPSCATATLEGYVCVLRKRLQPLATARGSLITTMAGCYAIDMSRVVDAETIPRDQFARSLALESLIYPSANAEERAHRRS